MNAGLKGRLTGTCRHALHLVAKPVAFTLLGAVAVACSSSSSPTDARPAENGTHDEFWSALSLEGVEAEQPASLSQMKRSADAVLLGHFSDFGVSRSVQGDAPEDVVVYGVAQFVVDRAIAGRDLGNAIPVEFILPFGPDRVDEGVAALEASLPVDQAVLFARDKGGNEVGLYRPINSRGLWVESDDGTVDTPLASDPAALDVLYSADLLGTRSLEQFSALVASL